MAFLDEAGFCRKTISQVPKNCFFRTRLDCFQSTQHLYYMWIELGNRNLVPPITWRKLSDAGLWDEIGLCRKTIFQAPKRYFFAHAWTASNPPKIYMWIGLGI